MLLTSDLRRIQWLPYAWPQLPRHPAHIQLVARACAETWPRLCPSRDQPDISDTSDVAVSNFLPLCQLWVPVCMSRLIIAPTLKGCGMELNETLYPEQMRCSTIIKPPEREQETEERQPGGRKPQRRQSGKEATQKADRWRGLWAMKAGIG